MFNTMLITIFVNSSNQFNQNVQELYWLVIRIFSSRAIIRLEIDCPDSFDTSSFLHPLDPTHP